MDEDAQNRKKLLLTQYTNKCKYRYQKKKSN